MLPSDILRLSIIFISTYHAWLDLEMRVPVRLPGDIALLQGKREVSPDAVQMCYSFHKIE